MPDDRTVEDRPMIAPPVSTEESGVAPSQPERATNVRPLAWDTAFFGSRMGVLDLPPTPEGPDQTSQANLLEFDVRVALAQARTQGYEHLIVRVPAENLPAVWAVEQAGFRLVDIGLDSTFAFATRPLPAWPTIGVRPGRLEDLPTLRGLAADAFRLSRFSADPFFSDEQVRDFHREWVKNLYEGLAQAVLVCELDGALAGFVTCARSGDEGRIPLIATRAGFRRRGVGRGLVSAALRWFAEAGARVAHVKTQSVNYPALALYHRAGFAISTSELTFSVTLSPVGE
jgi:ribosomal protein S18 acetylase RimI-like enzyme